MSALRSQLGVMGGLLVLSAFLAAAGLVLADPPPDPLEMSRKEAELKANKLKSLVAANFVEARKYELTDPEKAQAILRQNRELIEQDDVSLTERERTDLKQQIDRRLRDINNRINSFRQAKEAVLTRDDFNKKLEAEAAKVNSGPTPYTVLKAKQQQMAAQLKEKQDEEKQMAAIKKAQNQAYLDYLSGKQPDQTQQSLQPGYQTPADKSQKLSEGEIALIRALLSTKSVEFKTVPLRDVIDYLDEQTQGNITFAWDDVELTKKGVDTNVPITFKGGKKLTIRQILHSVLRSKKLDFYIEDGIVTITTIDKAEKQKIMKMYPISNLISTPGSNQQSQQSQQQLMQQMQQLQMLQMQAQMKGGRGGAMPQLPNPQMMMQQSQSAAEINNVRGLVAVLENSIEPTYWDVLNPGNPSAIGHMDYDPRTKSLIVVASQEIQYLLIASQMLRNVPPQPQQ